MSWQRIFHLPSARQRLFGSCSSSHRAQRAGRERAADIPLPTFAFAFAPIPPNESLQHAFSLPQFRTAGFPPDPLARPHSTLYDGHMFAALYNIARHEMSHAPDRALAHFPCVCRP